MGRAETAASLEISVAYSPRAGVVDEVHITLAAGATVRDAVERSRLPQRHPEIDLAVLRTGVWGKLRALDDPLRDRDRVEIYRPLRVDPKEARRQRYRQHRERFKT